MKPTRVVLLALGMLVALLVLAIWWAIGSSLPRHSHLDIQTLPGATSIAPKTTLSVATYNIAHGQGIKAHPTDWRDAAFTKQKMTELSAALKALDADIVFLQEIDLDSNRTHHINQPEWLMKAAGYPFSACALVWDKNYIPFPYWPIERHVGQMRSANCILSRYPLSDHSRLVFDKPEGNPFWYNWGYIDRAAQHLVANVGEQKITLINVHFEAYEKQAREKQARDLLDWIKDMPGPMVIGGDFNSIPKEGTKRDHFVDEPNDNYIGDNTVEILRQGLPGSTEAISTTEYVAHEQESLTFPSNEPTRRLDYIFAIRGASVMKGRVVKEAGLASDHFPVWAQINF